MKIEQLRPLVEECIRNILSEGWYSQSATPHFSKTDTHINLGRNPLYTDNGKHSSQDVVRQASTVDYNGANFRGEHIVLSDNKFMIYKIKNFNSDKISSTLSLFGSGANGEKELRRAIDTLNGAATRNSKSLKYRTITSESSKRSSESSGHMTNTFWEFSYDNGTTWYILKPNPVQNMKQSKLIQKSN